MNDYNAIYLAPHLDDAALSCGAQIFDRTAAGERVLIVTVMAGDPPAGQLSFFAQTLHERWALAASVVAQRRAEDATACRILGADHEHWQIPDCIYRTNPDTADPLYASESAIFGNVDPVETFLVDEVVQRLAALPAAGRLFAPLAIGHHVDHQLVRAAAARYAGAALFYYEDYPYVQQEPAAARALVPAAGEWQSTVVPVSADGVAARIEAVAAFASQLSTFFNGRADLTHQIHSHVRLNGGERYWHCLP